MARFFIIIFIFYALTGCATLKNPPGIGNYTLITVGSTQDNYQFMKYSPETGRAWILGDGWMPIEDEAPLPESRYVIKMVALPGSRYIAVRMDMRSGLSWSVEDRKWIEFGVKGSDRRNTGPGGVPPATSSGIDEYHLITEGLTENAYNFIRYSQLTGQAWILGVEWEPIEDEEAMPRSHYVVEMVSMPIHRYIAVRLDTRSGRSWSVEKHEWVEIETGDSVKPATD